MFVSEILRDLLNIAQKKQKNPTLTTVLLEISCKKQNNVAYHIILWAIYIINTYIVCL